MRKDELAGMLTALSGILPRNKPDLSIPGVISIWYQAMSPYPTEDVKRAFSQASCTLSEFPVIAKIKELIDGPTVSRWSQAESMSRSLWASMVKIGYPNHERAERELSGVEWEAIRQMGGWVEFCGTSEFAKESTLKSLTHVLVSILAREGINDKGHKMLGESNKTRGKVERLAGGMSKNTLHLL